MKYIKCLRVKHYIKNLLIFVPAFFSGHLLDIIRNTELVASFFVFSFVASFIYITNDIVDIENDKKNVYKKNRPIASGDISVKNAVILLFLLMLLSFSLILLYNINIYALGILVIYISINIIYSFYGKNVAVFDIVLLSLGYILRILFGGFISNTVVSKWLYLTVFSFSLFFAFEKRRNEYIMMKENGRKVLSFYSYNYLNLNTYVFAGISIIFYSLWTLEVKNDYVIYTVLIVCVILLLYLHEIEKDNNSGDPVEVVFKNKFLLLLLVLYVLMIFIIYY